MRRPAEEALEAVLGLRDMLILGPPSEAPERGAKLLLPHPRKRPDLLPLQ